MILRRGNTRTANNRISRGDPSTSARNLSLVQTSATPEMTAYCNCSGTQTHPNCNVQPPIVGTPPDFTQLRQSGLFLCNFGKDGKGPYVSPTQPSDNFYCNTSPLHNQNMCMSVLAYIPMDNIGTHMSWTRSRREVVEKQLTHILG